jgi:hypothetical protein
MIASMQAGMGQMSWRAPDELLARVRAAADEWGWSMNEYVTRVLSAATDPAYAGDESSRLRERLARAGLLAPAGSPRRRPSDRDVAGARRAAGRGTPLSDLVARERR